MIVNHFCWSINTFRNICSLIAAFDLSHLIATKKYGRSILCVFISVASTLAIFSVRDGVLQISLEKTTTVVLTLYKDLSNGVNALFHVTYSVKWALIIISRTVYIGLCFLLLKPLNVPKNSLRNLYNSYFKSSTS